MGEVQFAKQFLTTLDSKSTKYQPDHIFDPREFQTRVPYTLPRLSHPPHPLPPGASTSAPPPPGSTAAVPAITVLLKSTRNPALDLKLEGLDAGSTSIQSLKEAVQSALGGASVVSIEKVKILLSKKPVPPTKKTVLEVLDGKVDKEVEFGVMVIGGAPDPPPQQLAAAQQQQAAGPGSENAAIEATAPGGASDPMQLDELSKTTSPRVAQPGEASGKDVLDTAEFWEDLQGFLAQRIKDVDEAQRIRGVFQGAWKALP